MKRVQKCGICKEIGHNRRNCPKKDILQSEINEIENDNWNIDDIEYIDSRNDERYIDMQQGKIDIRRGELELENENIKSKKIELGLKEKYNLKILTQELKRKKDESLKKWLDKKLHKLWFDTQKECGTIICHYLIEENKYIALAVAQPGVGKTNLIQYLIYHLKAKLNPDKMIIGDRITIATGMSSRDWIDQTEKGTTLLDKNNNEKIYHRDTLNRRIKYLKDNPELLSDHVFIIDECHIACDKEQTIDNLLNRDLKLTKKIIQKFKIKIIFISATPDIILAELENKHEDEWQFCVLEPGEGYRGFEFIRNKKWLYDYDNLKINEKEIFKSNINKYSKPKYHIIRIRGKASENFKKMIVNLILYENIGICEEHNEKNKIENFEDKLKEEPDKHTFVFIKEFYRASKRLRLTKNIGMIIEPSVNNDVTVTAQNLLARFFGYYDDSELEFTEPPMFICNEKCVDTYLEFANNFTYDGIDYKSRKIKENGEIRGNIQSYQNNYIADIPITQHAQSIEKISFDSFEELKIYGEKSNKKWEKKLWIKGPIKDNYLKWKDEKGFFYQKLGTSKDEKRSVKYFMEEKTAGSTSGQCESLDGKYIWFVRVAYEDTDDSETLKWILTIKNNQ